MICPKCGEPMRMTEKDTSSGRDIREYHCDGCGHDDWEDRGKALWQILHDDREEFLAAEAKRAAAEALAETPPPAQPTAGSSQRGLWSRLCACFVRGR